MSLGGNADSSEQAFFDAMRKRLETLENNKDALAAIDEEGGNVRKNLNALGQAVYQILTENAETVASVPTDPAEESAFWTWVRDVHIWLQDLYAWQQDVAIALGVPQPPAPPSNVPTEIRGRIE